MTVTSSEIEEVELADRTLFEAAFWMDWWLYATWSVILEKCDNEGKCYHLFVAVARDSDDGGLHLFYSLGQHLAEASECSVI